MHLQYILATAATMLFTVSSFPHDHGKRQLDGYQAPVVTPTASSSTTLSTATAKATTTKAHATKTKQPRPPHSHKTAEYMSINTGSYSLIGSLNEAATSVPLFLGTNPYGSHPTGTNPLGSCYLGTAYGCTSGGTGRLSPTTQLPPPIYPNITSTCTSSASLDTTSRLSSSIPSSSTASSSNAVLPYGPLPPGPPAFPTSVFSALEAGATASPTTSSPGVATYQSLVGRPLESGAAPPLSTASAGSPGPPLGPPRCPPPIFITLTSITTVTVTPPAPVTLSTAPPTVPSLLAPFGLGNGTTFHGSTGGTGTGSYSLTVRTAVSVRSATKASDTTSVGSSTSAETSATAAALSPYS